MIRIGMFQADPRIGDFERNLALLKQAISSGCKSRQGVSLNLVVATELATCGYYPQDLLERENFLASAAMVELELLEYSKQYPSVALVYGTPVHEAVEGRAVARLYNALRVIRNGKVLGTYRKTMLPSYGLFNERRVFCEGSGEPLVLDIDGAKVGFLICEDLWGGSAPSKHYGVDPVANTVAAGAEIIVSINASPFEEGKSERRHELVSAIAAKHQVPVVYVNQIGAEEHVIYDGGSFVANKFGDIVYELDYFDHGFGYLSIEGSEIPMSQGIGGAPAITEQEYLIDALCYGLKQYLQKSGMSKVIVGCSGGLDSAITLALATRAIGPENVIAVTMPSQYSSAGSVDDSVELCQNLGIKLRNIPIEGIVGQVGKGIEEQFLELPSGVARENLQARARGTILMTVANQYGLLLLTTGNKSEAAVGYFTMYGDSCGGLNLIGDLYKTEVYALSYALNALEGKDVIPLSILQKEPSAELAPGQRDEDSLPPYPVLDYMLKYIIEDEGSPDEWKMIQDLRGITGKQMTLTAFAQTMKQVRSLVLKSEFKRYQMAPTLRVKKIAFGQGRQIPLTSSWVA